MYLKSNINLSNSREVSCNPRHDLFHERHFNECIVLIFLNDSTIKRRVIETAKNRAIGICDTFKFVSQSILIPTAIAQSKMNVFFNLVFSLDSFTFRAIDKSSNSKDCQESTEPLNVGYISEYYNAKEYLKGNNQVINSIPKSELIFFQVFIVVDSKFYLILFHSILPVFVVVPLIVLKMVAAELYRVNGCAATRAPVPRSGLTKTGLTYSRGTL